MAERLSIRGVVLVLTWVLSLAAFGDHWPKGEHRIAAYEVDGFDLLDLLRKKLNVKEGQLQAERWTGEVPRSRFIGANDRLWDLSSSLSSEAAPLLSREEGAWAVFNETTGRMLVRGSYLNHLGFRYVLDELLGWSQISMEATIWKGRTAKEKGRKLGRVGMITRSSLHGVGRMVGEESEMTLEGSMDISSNHIGGSIDLCAQFGGKKVVLKSSLPFEDGKSRWIELGDYTLELQANLYGWENGAVFEQAEQKHRTRTARALVRRHLPDGDVLQARDVLPGLFCLDNLLASIRVDEVDNLLEDQKSRSWFAENLRLYRSGLKQAALPVAIGELQKGTTVLDLRDYLTGVGIELDAEEWAFHHVRSSTSLCRLASRNDDLFDQMLENVLGFWPRPVRVSATLIEEVEGTEVRLKRISALAGPGTNSIVQFGDFESGDIEKGLSLTYKAALSPDEQSMELRFSVEQKGEDGFLVSQEVRPLVGQTLEYPLEGKRLLRLQATVEE